MKVTIDNIIGSAKRINKQRQPDEQSQNNKKGEVRSDTVRIENRVMSRLDSIQKELREVQSSLTKNQIVKDGLFQLRDDMAKGGRNMESIITSVRFENRPSLREFIGEKPNTEAVKSGIERSGRLINEDISKLKKLQVEVENILASDIGSGKIKDNLRKLDTLITAIEHGNMKNISHLKSETVTRLVKG